MNYYSLAASGLMFLTAGVHAGFGTPEIHIPIQGSELSPYLRAISAVLWHGITVILVVFTAGLLWCAKHPNRALEATMSAVQLGFAALFLFYGIRGLGEVVTMPQWVIFLIIPAITALGWRAHK